MKKLKIYLLTTIFLTAIIAVSFARADDENEKEKEGSPKTEYVTQTVIVKPAQIVTKTVMQDFIASDSDRDGLIDENDPHPTVPEMIIVADQNNDGVDDQYEY